MDNWEKSLEAFIESLKAAESREGRPPASEVVSKILQRMEEEDLVG